MNKNSTISYIIINKAKTTSCFIVRAVVRIISGRSVKSARKVCFVSFLSFYEQMFLATFYLILLHLAIQIQYKS